MKKKKKGKLSIDSIAAINQNAVYKAKEILSGYCISWEEVYKIIEHWRNKELKYAIDRKKRKEIKEMDLDEIIGGLMMVVRIKVENKITEIQKKEFDDVIDVRKILRSNYDKKIINSEVEKLALFWKKSAEKEYKQIGYPTKTKKYLERENVKGIEATLHDIPDQLTEIFIQALMPYLDNNRRLLSKAYPQKEKNKEVKPQKLKVYNFIEQKRKETKLTGKKFWKKFEEEIIEMDLEGYEKFENEKRDQTIKGYLNIYSQEVTPEEANNYWNGNISEIPLERYKEAKKSGLLNKCIGTPNKEYARKEFKLFFPESTDKEFESYYDAYRFYLNREIWRLKSRAMFPELKKNLEEKIREINKFRENMNGTSSIYFKGSAIKINSLNYEYYQTLVTAMRQYRHGSSGKKQPFNRDTTESHAR